MQILPFAMRDMSYLGLYGDGLVVIPPPTTIHLEVPPSGNFRLVPILSPTFDAFCDTRVRSFELI